MAKPVDQGRAKRFVLYYFLPAGEGQVSSRDRGPFTGSQGEVVEELLASLFVEADVSELVTDDKIICQEAVLELAQGPCRLRFPDLCK